MESIGDPKDSGKEACDPDLDKTLLACPNVDDAAAPVSPQKLRTPSISLSIGVFQSMPPSPADLEKEAPWKVRCAFSVSDSMRTGKSSSEIGYAAYAALRWSRTYLAHQSITGRLNRALVSS